jgi:putative membrane protein
VPGPRRWPGWVYGAGEEPDYRFSFANERTFLAWVRTSLALMAAGVALDAVDLSIPERAQHALAFAFVVIGVLSAAVAWVRWARAERAMRSKDPLPAFGWGAVFALAVVLAGLLLVAVAF